MEPSSLLALDVNAVYPWESYRAVSGTHEYRAFHDPEERHGEGPAWILGVRAIQEDRVPTHVHYHAYRTDAEARQAAELWQG